LKLAILLGVREPHRFEELPENLDRKPHEGIEVGYKRVEPADLYPSQALADRAYRMREGTTSIDHITENWQNQGERLCYYENERERADEIHREKAPDPVEDA